MARPAGVPINEFALRDFREVRGFAAQELALRAGISPSYYSEIENGTASPSRQVLTRLADSLVISPLSLERFVKASEQDEVA